MLIWYCCSRHYQRHKVVIANQWVDTWNVNRYCGEFDWCILQKQGWLTN